ncbi:MAG: peptide ABC transporter substrate-binding protein [Patescibacteria group bacterium]|nr:peptide ABC transporter substrate-binding protein [Patescibacteria group bacterium]MDE1966302.1 peptide ABC transporter substrate-binding protein [Patescibacteria group bacterium]
MQERATLIWNKLTRHRTTSWHGYFESRFEAMSAGDKALTVFFGVLVLAAAAAAWLGLENRLLVSVPADGGSLTEGVLGSPRFVNPLLALSDADRDLTALTYAGLMGIDGDGNLVPVLASGYRISPDGKTYTFTLRKDAKFSDGTPVTADDVVFTVEKAQDPGLKSPEQASWDGIEAKALDATTVEFTLPSPYAPFLENTTLGILPANLWRNVSDEQFPFSDLETAPVGAGPFVVKNVSRNASGIITDYTLGASRTYVLGRPHLDRISFSFFSRQEDLAAALAAGAVDSAHSLPGADALTAPYAEIFGVFFNPNENAVFARAEVRQALSLAIDREAITADVLGGYATPIMGPVPPGSGITETPVPASASRIKDAAAILEKGGWTYDSDARTWKNKAAKQDSLSVTIRTSNVPELKAVASAVKADWEELGVPTDIELYEPGDLNQNVIRPRKFDALLFGMVVGRDRDLFAFWDSQERNDPGLNIASYANKNVDKLLEAARTESDPAKRVQDLQQIEDDISADYPAAFLYAPDFLYRVPAWLKGVTLPQITTPSDRFASVAGWYAATEKVWPFLVPGGNAR